MVPVTDLRLQPGFDRCGRPLDAVEGPAPDLLQVRPGELDAVAERGIFEVGADPSALDHRRQKPDLVGGGRTEIQVGRPPGGVAVPRGRR